MFDHALNWGVPLVVTLLAAAAVAWVIHVSLPRSAGHGLARQIGFVLILLAVPFALVLAWPFDIETRKELVRLFGLIGTAIVALASTGAVRNIIAGFALRFMDNFHPGDFIEVEGHFGRVTERDLLHIEIQSIDRDLITLPNLFVTQHPVKVVRASGTLISTEVSIGYDVYRRRVSDALKAAAEQAELTDPFVQITTLGDFSVTYRVCGFLGDIGNLVSKRTQLRAYVLDALHDEGIEIMSPNVMAQRPLAPDAVLIPSRDPVVDAAEEDHGNAEKMMFDKADIAARIKHFEEESKRLTSEIEELRKSAEDETARIHSRERQLQFVSELLNTLKAGKDAR